MSGRSLHAGRGHHSRGSDGSTAAKGPVIEKTLVESPALCPAPADRPTRSASPTAPPRDRRDFLRPGTVAVQRSTTPRRLVNFSTYCLRLRTGQVPSDGRRPRQLNHDRTSTFAQRPPPRALIFGPDRRSDSGGVHSLTVKSCATVPPCWNVCARSGAGARGASSRPAVTKKRKAASGRGPASVRRTSRDRRIPSDHYMVGWLVQYDRR